MKLFTKAIEAQLLKNGVIGAKSHGGHDPKPVCKIFTPQGGATWLLTELDPNDHDRAFGLCDLGLGEPELGYVSIKEIIETMKSLRRLPPERDRYWSAQHTLSVYAARAREAQRIKE